jgi:membrane protein DedA with SNARE-associated domain
VNDDWPWALTFGVFFVIALARGTATYWAGRALRYGGQHTAMARHLDRPAVMRAEAVVRRFGAPAVAVSFLTIGFQTVVNAAAGALRMPWWRYVPGVVVGALFWATVYTTIGFAVLAAWFGDRPWPWVVAAVVAVALVTALTLVVRHRRAARSAAEVDHDDQPA